MKKFLGYTGILVLQFHILRNISNLYYIFLFTIVSTSLIIFFFNKNGITKKVTYIQFLIILFLFYTIFIAIHTIINFGLINTLIATTRYLLVLLIIPLISALLQTSEGIKKTLIFFSVYILVSLFTIPLQLFFTGPLSFLPEPGERAGLIRYSTNLGSLTVSGGAIILAAIVFRNLKMRSLYIISNIIGFFTLQKLFIGGLVLELFFHLRSDKKYKILNKFIFASCTLIVVLLVAKSIPEFELIIKYFQDQISGQANTGGDIGIIKSALSRLYGDLVTQAFSWLIDFKGTLGLLYGGGFGMIGPALMPENSSPYYTSHNWYFDFILMGGIPYLLIVILLLLQTIKKLKTINDLKIRKTLIQLFIFLCIMGFFGGGITFQPILALFFWTIILIANKSDKINENLSTNTHMEKKKPFGKSDPITFKSNIEQKTVRNFGM
jgi:hypothetical protein